MQRGGTWLAGMSMTGALYLSSVKKVISLLLSLCFSYTPHTLTLSVTRHTAPSCYVLLKRQSSRMALLQSQQRRAFQTKRKLLLSGVQLFIYLIFSPFFFFFGECQNSTWIACLLCSAALALYQLVLLELSSLAGSLLASNLARVILFERAVGEDRRSYFVPLFSLKPYACDSFVRFIGCGEINQTDRCRSHHD